MKPLKLTMSAWGSYPGETKVDFTKFQEGNLFLITGPTGAGKTTIFDAISFALYGNVSGKTREKASVRSDFSKPEIDTYVELIFSHRGQLFTVNRKPKYERPKKRGEGFTTSNETADLYIENHEPISVVADVNKKIEEIIGINYSQFKQIIMIAQGEFLELLVSNSKDRVQILRSLFQTGHYDKLQKILAEKSKNLYSKIEQLKNKMDESISTIDVLENKELSELLESEYYQYERILELTQELVKEESLQVRKLQVEIEDIALMSKKLLIIITEGEATNNKIIKLKQTKDEIILLESKKESIVELEEKLRLAKLAVKVLLEQRVYYSMKKRLDELGEKYKKIKEEIQILSAEFTNNQKLFEESKVVDEEVKKLEDKYRELVAYIPLFNELKNTADLSDKITKDLEGIHLEQTRIEKQKRSLEIDKQNLLKDKDELAFVEQWIGENNLELANYKRIESDIKEIFEKNKRCEIEEKILAIFYDKYEKLDKLLKEKKEIYEASEDLYKKSAIGLAAKYLEENMPCPVCGSLEHPNKAVVSRGVLDEEEISKLKESYEVTLSEYNQVYNEAAGQSGIVKGKKSEKEELLKVQEVNDLSELKNKLLLVSGKLDNLQKRSFDLNSQLEKKSQIGERLIKIDSTIEDLAKEEINYKGRYDEVKSQRDVLEGKKVQIIKKLPVDLTIVEVKKETMKLEQSIKELIEYKNKTVEIYQDSKIRLEKKQSLLEDTKTEGIKVKKELELAKGEYEQCMRDNGFTSEEEYQQSLIKEDEMTAIEKQVKSFHENYQIKNDQRKTLENEVANKETLDLINLNKELETIEELRLIKQNSKQLISTRIVVNKKAIDSISSKLLIRKQLDNEYGVVKDLDNVTKGTNGERLVFEHYVLSSYFEDIIQAANIRLSRMTNSRYELLKVSKVSDARTTDSLDLEVIDHYTGKTRSVKTLSGGESFKAALSLALGLSDIVQNNAGGIEIETLFIDEGFGSLDSQSLDQALNTLTSLTKNNRLIGIVSHVNELKERIDNQIIIDKGNQGSTLRIQNGG